MRPVHFDFYVDQLGFSGLQGKKLVLLANLVPNKKRLHTKFGNRKKKKIKKSWFTWFSRLIWSPNKKRLPTKFGHCKKRRKKKRGIFFYLLTRFSRLLWSAAYIPESVRGGRWNVQYKSPGQALQLHKQGDVLVSYDLHKLAYNIRVRQLVEHLRVGELVHHAKHSVGSQTWDDDENEKQHNM